MPFGIAQQASTPSRSSRRSQCSRRAECSWITKRGCLALERRARPGGSGVAAKSRLTGSSRAVVAGARRRHDFFDGWRGVLAVAARGRCGRLCGPWRCRSCFGALRVAGLAFARRPSARCARPRRRSPAAPPSGRVRRPARRRAARSDLLARQLALDQREHRLAVFVGVALRVRRRRRASRSAGSRRRARARRPRPRRRSARRASTARRPRQRRPAWP